MGLRAIPSFMVNAAVAEVDARLASVRRDHGVRILLAIESGSRAWGFPSPDSDYDCRFIYLQPVENYLSLFPRRDVIEIPLEGEMDLNGWDLSKALRLLLKGNAVVIEWLTSPIHYDGDATFREDMIALSRVVNRTLVARHYLHLGERQRHAYFADETEIALKKIFYALRPAAALRWMRLHPDVAVAPMNFLTLMDQSDVATDVSRIVAELMERKAATRELGKGMLPKEVGAFIDTEFMIAREAFEGCEATVQPEAMAAVDEFFRDTLGRYTED